MWQDEVNDESLRWTIGEQKVKTTAIGAGADDDSDLFKLMQDEARRLGQNFVGTEQILIALVSCHSGIAHGVLADLGFTLEVARAEVESIIGRGSGFVAVEIPFTPRAKRVLELAWDEARQLGHNYIGSEHILLGLVREGEGVGARVLKKLNIDRTLVRDCVKKRLKSKGEE